MIVYAGDETQSPGGGWLYVAVRGSLAAWGALVERRHEIVRGGRFKPGHEPKWRQDRRLRLPMLEAMRDAGVEMVAWHGPTGGRVARGRRVALIELMKTAGGTGDYALVLLDSRDAASDQEESKNLRKALAHHGWQGPHPAWAHVRSHECVLLQYADFAAGAVGACVANPRDEFVPLVRPMLRLYRELATTK